MIQISVISGKFDADPVPFAFGAWADFAAWFTTVRATDQPKDALAGWIPATFNGPRADAHVTAITVLVYDVDHGADLARIEAALAGLSYAIAPTYSSTETEPRFRLAVELAAPVTPGALPGVWARYAEAVGADKSCKNPSRFYYEPAAPVASLGVVVPGKALDPAAPPPPSGKPGPFSGLAGPAQAEEGNARSRWYDKAERRLDKACKRIKKAGEGERNNTLNRETFAIGRMTPHILTTEHARNRLLEACQTADHLLPSAEAENHVIHALADGAKKPIFTDQNWHEGLVWDPIAGGIKQCGGNVFAVFSAHTDLAGILAFDLRRDIVLLETEPPWCNEATPRRWADGDSVKAMHWLGKLTPSILTTTSVVHEVAATVARVASMDPFADWLEGLAWDGENRLDIIPREFMGSRVPFEGVLFRRWMIAAVARTFAPGCKVDTMLVLIGEQASGKSSFLFELVPDPAYYTGRIPRGDKDQLMTLQGPVIVDDGELKNYGLREVEELKAFVTEQVDRYRAPYAREVADHPRRCVLAATTNRSAFLRDDTGGRRFWPVTVAHRIQFDLVPLIRDELWAEATARYRAGEQWWLTEAEEVQARRIQEIHREKDPIEEVLAKRLAETHVPGDNIGIAPEQLDRDRRLFYASLNLACRLANVSINDQNGLRRVSKALTALGWRHGEYGWTRTS